MKQYQFIIKSFSLLTHHKPGKLLLIFLLTLLMAVNSGFSLVLLIPLLQLMNIGNQTTTDGVAMQIQKWSEKAGIPLQFETLLLIYLLLITVSALLNYWKSILDARYQQTFIYEIRRRIFRKIILCDWSLLNSKSKTNHLQVLTVEVPNLANYFFFYLKLLTTLLTAFAYVGYAMLVSPKFTLIIIIAGLLLFILLRKFLFKAFALGQVTLNAYNLLFKYIDDFWQTVKIAKVHGSEAYYYKKFEEANSSMLNMEYQLQKNNSLPRLIYHISGILVLILVVYVGYRIDQVPLASFIILIMLFSRIFPLFVSMNTDINMILSNLASVKLVMKVDDEFPDNSFPETVSQPIIALEKEMKLENLNFSYPHSDKLLENFSTTIPAKKITGIVGESGRGKTTLIDLIAGLQKPGAGKILIDGEILGEEMIPFWKSSIGYLPQDSFFIDGTFRENLVWDSREQISDKEIYDVLEQVNATHLVKRFKKELDEYIVNYQFNFSGGECQRLALARVMLRKPQLLLLDEATSSLDTENEKQIMEVLTLLKNKLTIIFVTHRTSILDYFDKVIRI